MLFVAIVGIVIFFLCSYCETYITTKNYELHARFACVRRKCFVCKEKKKGKPQKKLENYKQRHNQSREWQRVRTMRTTEIKITVGAWLTAGQVAAPQTHGTKLK